MKDIYKVFRHTVSLILLTALALNALAQQQVVTGVIADEQGNPMPGVNVIIKGTTQGASSDGNGKFYIEASNNDILVISFIGYKTQEVLVGNQTKINVQLTEDVSTLQEVVVVGYGEMKKSDITGSVASLKGDDLVKTVSSGVDQALAGRIAGVSTVQMSGQPGASVSIRIRGSSSINSGQEPLYVIDGVPISGNGGSVYDVGLGSVGGGGKTTYSPLSALNPNDIESIEVLKDASATAIYGNRGSNGVVIITTKRGKAGRAKISYDGYYGVQQLYRKLDMMNLQEYASFVNDLSAETASAIPDPTLADPSLLGPGTDWQDVIFRSAPMQNHQITISGGTDKNQYSISANYFDQQGTAIGSNFNRYQMRINLDAEAAPWLTFGTRLSVARTGERLGQYDRGGIIQSALLARPSVPAYNFDGSYSGGSGQGSFLSPIALALDRENFLKRVQILGNLFADIKIKPYLVFRTEFGGSADFTSTSAWVPTYDYGGGVTNAQNSINKFKGNNYFWQVKNYLTFNKQLFNDHGVNIMLGQEASEWGNDAISAGAVNLPTNDVKSINLGDQDELIAGNSYGSGALLSYFGRANYNYKEKYYATFTYRIDGSGAFAKGQRWGTFPAVALKWRLSQESFLAPISSVVNDLNLRVGWGQTGNSGIPGYAYGASLSTMATNLGLGFRVTNHANPKVTWETNEQVNLGLDVGFLESRVQLTVDVYQKVVKNLLNRYPLPAYMGSLGNSAIILQAPWVNSGKLENKGLEIVLKTVNTRGAVQWNTDFNVSFNRNKLIDLGIPNATLDGFTGGAGNILVTRTSNGMPLGEFYGYKVVGIFQNKEDILNSPVQWNPAEVDGSGNPILSRTGSVWPGDLKFADIDGNDTIDVRDRTYLGSPLPKFTFGFNNTVRYKNFDLEVFLVGSYGNKIYNFNKQGEFSGLADMRSLFVNQLQEVTGRTKLTPVTEAVPNWFDDINNVQVANPGSSIPRASLTDPNRNTRVSDRYLEDGSYIRIRSITLGYNIPAAVAQKIKFASIRVYTRVQNAFTITNYSGFDPEVGQDTWNPNVSGMDNGRYPSPRVFTVGVNATF